MVIIASIAEQKPDDLKGEPVMAELVEEPEEILKEVSEIFIKEEVGEPEDIVAEVTAAEYRKPVQQEVEIQPEPLRDIKLKFPRLFTQIDFYAVTMDEEDYLNIFDPEQETRIPVSIPVPAGCSELEEKILLEIPLLSDNPKLKLINFSGLMGANPEYYTRKINGTVIFTNYRTIVVSEHGFGPAGLWDTLKNRFFTKEPPIRGCIYNFNNVGDKTNNLKAKKTHGITFSTLLRIKVGETVKIFKRKHSLPQLTLYNLPEGSAEKIQDILANSELIPGQIYLENHNRRARKSVPFDTYLWDKVLD